MLVFTISIFIASACLQAHRRPLCTGTASKHGGELSAYIGSTTSWDKQGKRTLIILYPTVHSCLFNNVFHVTNLSHAYIDYVRGY